MGIAYNTNIVRDGLVLYLDAANIKSYPGTGTVWNDLSGNGNNGTLVNGVGYSSNNSGIMSFDGTNDYVDAPNGIYPASGITISAWVYLNSNARYSYNVMGSINSPNWFIMPMYPQNGWVYFYLRGDDGTQRALNTTTCPINQWVHITETFNGTQMKIYFNGNEIVSSNQTFNYTQINLQTFKVGQRGDIESYFSGNISNVSIYNRALSVNEIQQNFNALRGRYVI